MTTGYAKALSRLAQLPTNAAARKYAAQRGTSPTTIPDMRAWLRRAGHTETDLTTLRCIHVAGTKGKGTVCAYASSLLTAYGNGRKTASPVGLFTSPHVVTVRERIALNGQPISQEKFSQYFLELWDALERSKDLGLGPAVLPVAINASESRPIESQALPPFFHFMTLMAFHVFLREGVKDAVIECGIGGEHDATNILPVESVSASVITSIGLDHVEILGRSLAEIAFQKGGVIKPGVPCVISTAVPTGYENKDTSSVKSVLRNRWEACGSSAPFIDLTDTDIDTWALKNGLVHSLAEARTKRIDIRNVALAVTAVLAHTHSNLDVKSPLESIPDWVKTSLHKPIHASFRGRQETIVRNDVTWLLDGAHTVDSIRRLSIVVNEYLDERPGPFYLIFNQENPDRDPIELIEPMLETISHPMSGAIVTRNTIDDATLSKPAQISSIDVRHKISARLIDLGIERDNVYLTSSISQAIQEAERLAKANTAAPALVLVTGSFHLVGGVLRVLEGINDSPV